MPGLHEKQVKDINAALLDDNLVRQDKIGSVNVFWSFPATHAAELRAEVRAAQKQVVEARERLTNARASEAQALVGREDPDGSRAAKVREFKALAENRKALEAELETLKANDPEELCRLQKAAAECKDHANRWAENLCVEPLVQCPHPESNPRFALKQWLVKKKNVDPSQVDQLYKSVGLPDDLELD